MARIKAAIIVDNLSLTEWQKKSLKEVEDLIDLKVILNCTNTKIKRRYFKHFLYYVINFFSLKNKITQKVKLKKNKITQIDFHSNYKGIWQTIPSEVISRFKKEDIKLVLKFGMNLLRVDKNIENFDILSFHHGDPRKYRGRPAGFYEIYEGAEKQGIIVQKICNSLDGGIIYDLAFVKIFHYSYKKSAQYFYEQSPKILRRALINYNHSSTIRVNNIGPIYKLPSNKIILLFIIKLLFRKIKRIFYGLFIEKHWNIVQFQNKKLSEIKNIKVKKENIASIKNNYTFYADPFYACNNNSIFIEGMNAISGLGEIIELEANNFKFIKKVFSGHHFSYPFTIQDNGVNYLFPEVASHSPPYLIKEPFENQEKIILKGIEDLKIIDGTIFFHDNLYFLFFGLDYNSDSVLNLYFSEDLFGEYIPHPQNPIVINPKSARMAGKIILYDGKILRFGQNNCYGYGSKISVNQIIKINKTQYIEKIIDEVSFSNFKGPHTLNIRGNNFLLDFYEEKFSILAGYRRLSVSLKKYLSKL